MRRLLLWICVLAPMLALACYNDRDTLSYELKNKPDIQLALTGRFDRFPPLYYSMRVGRLRAKAKLSPEEYDDMAVALGRLGRNDEALRVLAQKSKLPNLTKDQQYRLYANWGTIKAHKWLQDGGQAKQFQLLHSAEYDIVQALQLNPNAHFGREGTQLEVIRWLMAMRGPKPPRDQDTVLSIWLRNHLHDVDIPVTLSGLVMLGGAWESPDVALAIGGAWRGGRRATIGLAIERYQELLRLGKHPIDEDEMEYTMLKSKGESFIGSESDPYSVAANFKVLRKEADEWHRSKTDYMMARLKSGRHPDTDPTFWSDWKEPAVPTIAAKPAPFNINEGLALIAGCIVALLLVTLAINNVRQRKLRLVSK